MLDFSGARLQEFKAVMELCEAGENVLIALTADYNNVKGVEAKARVFIRIAEQVNKINSVIDLYASATLYKVEIEIVNGVCSHYYCKP